MNERTPNGGVRSDILYMDMNGSITSEENASVLVIREFDEEDNIIFETTAIV